MSKDLRKRTNINKEKEPTLCDTAEGSNETIAPKKGVQIPVELRNTKDGLILRVLARSVVIFSLLITIFYSSESEKFVTFAKQNETLIGKGQLVECSEQYLSEVNKYEGCFPKECKRFVIDTVVSQTEAKVLLAIAKKGLKLGGSSGGASILDLHSGALSLGENFVNIYKNEEFKSALTESDFNTYRAVKEKIKNLIADHFKVSPEKIYLTYPTFFSEITSKEAVTVHDQYWHPHVDKETYKSFHYTSLLYLSDYNIDFTGGRFVFMDDRVNKTIEPRLGRVSMFTSGKENLHYVEKVLSGVRYAMTISFTCDKQYAVEDLTINKFL